MKVGFVSQYAGENTHYQTINDLLGKREFTKFRSLSAFVTIGGLIKIEEQIHNFLISGNSIEWIIGIDQGITSREALEFLKGLITTYEDQVSIKIFSAGTDNFIFHPKLYCFENEEECVIITGSANNTLGGLVNNFELSMVSTFKKEDEESHDTYSQFEHIWKQYSIPQSPLDDSNIINLNSEEGENLLKSVGNNEVTRKQVRKDAAKVKHPFKDKSKLKEIWDSLKGKHGNPFVNKKSAIAPTNKIKKKNKLIDEESIVIHDYIIMDILTETRRTQVQFPKKAVKAYFNALQEIKLYYRENNKIIFEGTRPLLKLTHNDTIRIELFQIKNFTRPLIMKMYPLTEGENSFVYELYDSNHPEFEDLNKSLADNGNQSRAGARRWLII